MDPRNYVLVDWVSLSITSSINSRQFACNTLLFINKGINPVTIDQNTTLQPGDSMTHELYPGEMNTHNYEIVFDDGDRKPGNKLVVWMKKYGTPPANSYQNTPGK